MIVALISKIRFVATFILSEIPIESLRNHVFRDLIMKVTKVCPTSKIPTNLICLSNSASSTSMSCSFPSPPHTLRHGILDGLFPKKCIEFIQFCQAIKRLLRVMKVERTVRTLWIFKNREVCEFFRFSSLARNSWKKLSASFHSKLMFKTTIFVVLLYSRITVSELYNGKKSNKLRLRSDGTGGIFNGSKIPTLRCSVHTEPRKPYAHLNATPFRNLNAKIEVKFFTYTVENLNGKVWTPWPA